MSMYERLFRSVLYPAYESVLRGRKTLRYLQEYERQQWLSPEELRALQTTKLRALLERDGFRVAMSRTSNDSPNLPAIDRNEIGRAHV